MLALFAAGLAGCDGSSPTSPTVSVAQPQPPIQTPQPTPSWPAGSLADVTLSGTVYEVTPGGRVPIDHVAVYCELCGQETHSWAYTDANGFYSFFGVWLDGGPNHDSRIGKDGFADPPGLPATTSPNPSGSGWRDVRVAGDTRFDVELVRR